MGKLDEIGIIEGCDAAWGSKRRYPTKEAFVEALKRELDCGVAVDEVTETYMRRCLPNNDDFDEAWCVCDGPARGATPVWEAR